MQAKARNVHRIMNVPGLMTDLYLRKYQSAYYYYYTWQKAHSELLNNVLHINTLYLCIVADCFIRVTDCMRVLIYSIRVYQSCIFTGFTAWHKIILYAI